MSNGKPPRLHVVVPSDASLTHTVGLILALNDLYEFLSEGDRIEAEKPTFNRVSKDHDHSIPRQEGIDALLFHAQPRYRTSLLAQFQEFFPGDDISFKEATCWIFDQLTNPPRYVR
ncbi:hypothetical protein J4464_05010 [Candidatus Woesearchaeota archaeon]|nr:hypothetical protein [Candidatus Woesearchaeota archaeon]